MSSPAHSEDEEEEHAGPNQLGKDANWGETFRGWLPMNLIQRQ
jgi:hypothetical protein